VEGADPDGVDGVADEVGDALAHFAGRFIGEGDGQDLPGRNAHFVDEVGDAVGQHPGFARAGAGQHEQGPCNSLCRFPLGGIERVEYRHVDRAFC
jgi:hypothetical protein